MTAAAKLGRQTFAALANRNYRRFIGGQGISLVGTWMQTVAQSWLVLELTRIRYRDPVVVVSRCRPCRSCSSARTVASLPTGRTSAA